MSMTTLQTLRNPGTVTRQWHLVDATGHRAGRLASQIATLLTGKHKPIYTPHLDVGDYVVVVNAQNIQLFGKRWVTKVYRWHSGWIGGLREVSAAKKWKHRPESILEHAVHGMLPKNNLTNLWKQKLKLYVGPEHPHEKEVKMYGSNKVFHSPEDKQRRIEEQMKDGYLLGLEKLSDGSNLLVFEAIGKEKENIKLLRPQIKKKFVQKIPYDDPNQMFSKFSYYPREYKHPHKERDPVDENEGAAFE
eukprot:TRINITY_DN5068_c0_g1_i1.p1 TRINITY_DN5068_c0_g1~~TRINITY_DN5068_c0_g1_i1.p1  ORF type:complete len:260 (-),score=85.88 TRINITY_DN5068_c0_g1_i1:183-923(-)